MLSSKQKHSYFNVGRDGIAFSLVFILLVYFFIDHKYSKLEWAIISGFSLLWLLIYFWGKLYYSNKQAEFSQILLNHAKAYLAFVTVFILFYLLFPIPVPNKRKVVAFVIGFPALGISLNLISDMIQAWFRRPRKNLKYTLVAGTGNMARIVERQLSTQRVSGYRIKGFVNCSSNEECMVPRENVVSSLSDIRQYLNNNVVDEIVIALPGKHPKKIQHILETADYFGIRVKYIPDYQELLGSTYKVTRFGEIDALNIRPLPIDERFHLFTKTSFDFLFSAIVLIVLSPLFLLFAILIKLESRGPVFYCPIRIGKSGKPFKVYKFRSMKESDAPADGTMSTKMDDPRITRLGRIMRKYSLDELPQFINVFKGEMSVVGPRPHRRFLDQQLQQCVYRYMIRHYVKPGITGWAQVNGWRGPTETDEQRRQRTIHDLWYLEHWTLWLDFKIIFLTMFSKKAHKTAY